MEKYDPALIPRNPFAGATIRIGVINVNGAVEKAARMLAKDLHDRIVKEGQRRNVSAVTHDRIGSTAQQSLRPRIEVDVIEREQQENEKGQWPERPHDSSID